MSNGKILAVHTDGFCILTRRRMLAGTGLTSLALLGGCRHPNPSPLAEVLRDQRNRASTDSMLAHSVEVALTDQDRDRFSRALKYVSQQRSEHAQSLNNVLSQLTGTKDLSLPSMTMSSAPTVGDLIEALQVSADQAESLAVEYSGYPAGLLASISAACVADYSYILAQQS